MSKTIKELPTIETMTQEQKKDFEIFQMRTVISYLEIQIKYIQKQIDVLQPDDKVQSK